MTPGARLAAAIAILDGFLGSESVLADRLLSDWARGARYAGSKDRAAVADLVYGALRRLGSARLGAAAPDGRAAALGALRLEGTAVEALAALADGGPHRPAPLSAAERAWLAGLPGAVAAEGAMLDFPDWLLPDLAASRADPAAEIAALSARAALDFRVNTLKASREKAAAALDAAGMATAPAPLSPVGLRARLGPAARPKLSRLAPYLEGLVEPQDAASQAAALIAAAALGSLDGLAADLCAGGGGKTLALAAAAPQARLLAYDVAPQRMRELPARAARAGARVEILDAAGLKALQARPAALALVDAPCSGSGAWARQPDAKWRLTPSRLAALQDKQDQALDLGASATAPGGALVYATCSLLRAENEAAIERFLARRSAFRLEPIAPLWRAAGLIGAPPDETATMLRLSPAEHGAEGFFVAVLRRRS